MLQVLHEFIEFGRNGVVFGLEVVDFVLWLDELVLEHGDLVQVGLDVRVHAADFLLGGLDAVSQCLDLEFFGLGFRLQGTDVVVKLGNDANYLLLLVLKLLNVEIDSFVVLCGFNQLSVHDFELANLPGCRSR